jgi:hypothetical protein
MAGGEMSAVFRGLAGDADHAAGNMGDALAKNFEDAASREDGNIARSLDDEATTTKSFTDLSGETKPEDPSLPGEAAPGQTGGSARPKVDDTLRSYDRNEQWAGEAYDNIRNSDDVPAIARNLRDAPRLDGSTGFSADDIAAVKSHVFDESHPLEGADGGVVQAPFEPNADMAEAWLRLRSGSYKPEDLTLLEHELAEHGYWQQNPEAIYWDAHGAANQVANWQDNIPEPSNEDYNAPWE